MEFGDIIYFLLLVLAMILGFFNDSRKKKKAQQKMDEEIPSYHYDEMDDVYRSRPAAPPSPPVKSVIKPSESNVFQSSLDQVSNYTRYDSGDSIDFDYDDNSMDYVQEGKSMLQHTMLKGRIETPAKGTRKTSDGKKRGEPHPYLVELYSDDNIDTLKKGFIYSEILHRKY